MPARALLVLLAMLNIGVALWWVLRPEAVPPAAWTQPDGVPRLQLLGEQAAAGTGASAALGDRVPGPASAGAGGFGDGPVRRMAAVENEVDGGLPVDSAAATDAGSTPSGAPALRCFSIGPYPSGNVAAAARQALQPLDATQIRMREDAGTPRAWQVSIAPQADRAAADALAARIREAGFEDLLVLAQGDDANGIALGRYSSAATARRRESALRDAGFAARAQPVGEVATQHWLDVAAGPGLDPDSARSAAGASQLSDIDCAGVVAAGPAR